MTFTCPICIRLQMKIIDGPITERERFFSLLGLHLVRDHKFTAAEEDRALATIAHMCSQSYRDEVQS